MRPFQTNVELLNFLEEQGHAYRVLGYAPGGRPLVAVRGGGDRDPPIVLSAGSHAGEHAGVRAAVELLDRLETDHRLYVFPTRDPVGLDGYAAALGTALGEIPELQYFEGVAEILRSEGDVIHDGECTIALISDYGFLNQYPRDDPDGHAVGESYLERLEAEDADVLEALAGRRIYLPPGLSDVEGTGDFDRAHTEIVDPDGRVKHLNRFHDSAWAPVEPRCLRTLFAETEPGLFIDLHESVGNGELFHFTLRRKDDPAAERRTERVGRAAVQAVDDAGGTLATWEDKFGETPIDEHHYTPVEDGLFWQELAEKGERTIDQGRPFYQTPGMNSSDFAAAEYGLGFGMDTGVYAPFEERVEQAVIAVESAVGAFEDDLSS